MRAIIGIVFAIAVVAALASVVGIASLNGGDMVDAANERIATLEYTEGLTWRVDNMVFVNQTADLDCVLPYGTTIIVSASVNAGYEGTPVLKANGIPYTAGTPYELTADTKFTATGVRPVVPKTEYIVNGEVYKTVYRDANKPVPLQVLYGDELKDKIILNWNNDPSLEGEWLSARNNVYPGDAGWEKVYADFEIRKYTVTFYYLQGMTWVCNGLDQSGGADIQVEYGKTVSVMGVVQPGYEGTPVLRLNSSAYIPGTAYNVTSDANFTATGVRLAPDEIETEFEVILHPGDGGKVEGAGTYPGSSTATIRAVPDEGFVFVGWSDGSKDQERTITIGSELTASFAPAPEAEDRGISSIVIVVAAVIGLGAVGAAVWFFRLRTP
jgi:hypothetical protein